MQIRARHSAVHLGIPAATRSRVWMAWVLAIASLSASAQPSISYAVSCESPGWNAVFQTFGLSLATKPGEADVRVLCRGNGNASDSIPVGSWLSGAGILVLEGDSPVARQLGVLPAESEKVEIRNVRDHLQPGLLVVWQDAQRLRPTRLPTDAKVLAEDRWTGVPLMASFPSGPTTVLWLAVAPGDSGYDRFPSLGNALLSVGFEPPLRSRSLWAFFDSAYRKRVDLAYVARNWRKYGIAALHISAWQHWERDPQSDAWLRTLIEECHRQGILAYAWLELPHVSERFWDDHPECREKTALGQDAQLDWRKLIDLSERSCALRVREQATALLTEFNWDGVNLAEIYYESLEGPGNPARFTPMNAGVRKEFQAASGFDPAALFDTTSHWHQARNPEGLKQFLHFRRERIAALHAEWLGFIQETAIAARKPLHTVVTQIDDRFDPAVRDNLGADSNAILNLMHQHPFTFLVEDPATIWHLGPARYGEIARAYATHTPYAGRLAIDINIFPRYQEVYPTKQQTGMELYRLVNAAARVFPRVALYFEHTLSRMDLPLLAAAAAPETRLHRDGDAVIVESRFPVGLRWRGPALVNGRTWAAREGTERQPGPDATETDTLWLPAGRHRVEPGEHSPGLVLQHLTGTLQQVRSSAGKLELHYNSASRAVAVFSAAPARLWIDEQVTPVETWRGASGHSLFLPAGEHLVRVEVDEAEPQSR